MLTHEELKSWYGWAELSPGDPIVAGSLGRWRVIYHVGRYGLSAGGSLKLVFPAASDWPVLQGRDPYEENFMTVSTTGRGRLAWRYEPRGHIQPWPKAVVVDVAQWGLAEGDTVTFYLGDPEGGSPGVRAQTFAEQGYEFRVLVDPFGSGQHYGVPSPRIDVVAGPPERLALVAPSQVAPGEAWALTLRLEDRWGNPATGYAGKVVLEGPARRRVVTLRPDDGGVKRLAGPRLKSPGLFRLRAREEQLGLEAESNPIAVRAGSRLPLWGDLGGQAVKVDDLRAAAASFRYARQVAGLDFCAHQSPDYQTSQHFWRGLQRLVRTHDAPGRFVAFLGYKWLGNTAGGGTRSVLFLADRAEIRRCSSAQLRRADPTTDCYPLPALHAALRGQEVLLIAGAGGPPASLDDHDSQLEPLIEVYSAEGECSWLLDEALQRGCRVGLVASSGDRRGRPGHSLPGAGETAIGGGLTCVYAAERTREAIWEALRARRCYATTGPRLLLDVQADGHPMGEAYRARRAPRLTVRVAGTAEIEAVEIRRGAEVVYRYPEQDAIRPGWIRLRWGGAMGRHWPRSAPWDGTLRCHGARILTALPYGFASPARGIFLANEQVVSWRSTTTGNENGLLLQLDGDPSARLELYVPLASLTVSLAELPYERLFEGENLHLRVEPLPQGCGTRDLELAWAEPALQPGTVPYYVVVQQVDGAKAWSSPIYVQGTG